MKKGVLEVAYIDFSVENLLDNLVDLVLTKMSSELTTRINPLVEVKSLALGKTAKRFCGK